MVVFTGGTMGSVTIIKTCPDGKDLTLLLVTTTAFPKGTRLHENGAGEELIGKANSSRGKKDKTEGRFAGHRQNAEVAVGQKHEPLRRRIARSQG
jgi:hypothetical protein